MSLSPEQRARLERLLADELGAAAVASAADDATFIAEIERRLSSVAEPRVGDEPEPEPV
jgi:hypothetical protein